MKPVFTPTVTAPLLFSAGWTEPPSLRCDIYVSYGSYTILFAEVMKRNARRVNFVRIQKTLSSRGRGICPERDLVDLVVRREAIFKALEWPCTHGVGARQCAVGRKRTKNASVRALPLGVGPTPYSDGTITSRVSRHASPDYRLSMRNCRCTAPGV